MNIMQAILISVVSGTVVAYLSPRFSHIVWKKQKRREQQLAIAERFEKLFSDLHIAGNIMPKPPPQGIADENSLKIVSRFFELEALFILMFVLFEREYTLSLGGRLRKSTRGKCSDIKALCALRAELLASMFAEALGISMKELEERKEIWGREEGTGTNLQK